jgi:nitrogen-specific signal transduction histidine kinase
VKVATSFPNSLPRVLGHEAALAEAFAHLVVNVAEASADRTKPHITLSAGPVGESGRSSGMIVTVRDNGKGIALDIKEKIFSLFCTTKPRGMGLGLPIVKRTVFDHHGRVDVDSAPKGTLVSVLLPTTPAGD